jgi:phosphoglycolate phosphatase
MNAPQRQRRAALFDLDGTLLDTAPDMAAALNSLRAEESLAALDFAEIRCQVSHGSNAVVRLGFPDAAGEEFEALRVRFLAIYRLDLASRTRAFPGFETTLTALESAGIPWGVVTNKPGWLTDPLLAALGLAGRAGCVVSGDSLPERKPHPRPLLVAAGLLGIDPAECIYVGDARRDIDAALAAGMLPLGARFGYLGPADDPASWPAAAWLDDPRELLPWFGLAADSGLTGHG